MTAFVKAPIHSEGANKLIKTAALHGTVNKQTWSQLRKHTIAARTHGHPITGEHPKNKGSILLLIDSSIGFDPRLLCWVMLAAYNTVYT